MIITEDDGSRWLSLDTSVETSSDLYRLLEAGLRDKGATDAWLIYALPDLFTSVQQFMQAEWRRGYEACSTGKGAGAFQPPRVGDESLPEFGVESTPPRDRALSADELAVLNSEPKASPPWKGAAEGRSIAEIADWPASAMRDNDDPAFEHELNEARYGPLGQG